MSALYPDVPNTIGVPLVLRDSPSVDGYGYEPALDPTPLAPAPSDWGIYDRSGMKLVEPDNVVSLEYHGEHRIADYPVENGGFQSYNKVATPTEIHLVMTKGGSVADRTAFVDALEKLRVSLDLCDVATPERVYVGVNLLRLGQSRSAEAGAGLATLEVTLQEVRETAMVAYSTAATPSTTPTPTAAPAASTSPVAAPAPAKAAQPATGKAFTNGATANPSSARMVNQGLVQPRAGLAPGEKITKNADGSYTFSFKGMK